jgi:hypothetical protein
MYFNIGYSGTHYEENADTLREAMRERKELMELYQ